ncbi:MAG: hypothetical protein ACFE7E_05780 [Candidatus Hodarchaeota archaeon]
MSNRKAIARVVVVVWLAFLIISLVLYFIRLLPTPLYIAENLWVLAVILIPFIIVVAQSAFTKGEEEDATAINLFDNSETNLANSMILELPAGKDQINRNLTTSSAVQDPSQVPNNKGSLPPEEGTSWRTKSISEVESEKDAVLSLLEGLDKQSAEGKISPDTYESLKQKYRERLEDLTNRLVRMRRNES